MSGGAAEQAGGPALRELAFRRFDEIVLGEIERARPRIRALRRRYPDAGEKALATHLVHAKKAYAGTGGAVSGLFGLVALPADLLLVTYLQIALIVEIGLVHRANLKSRRGQQEILEILGRGNGVGPLYRSGTPVLARIATRLMARKGIPLLGRAVPFVAAPVSAWLNNRDIERVGQEAMRHYGMVRRLREKRRP
ncbi:MAG: hypothetical protein D6729_03285 [Deltaproteobacteria bacterium]|nr:MAG: hypothetical protein D6729_03285 [Deltaproteobacteria bacterium]